MARAVGSVKGLPLRLIFLIGQQHIQRIMDLAGLTLTQRRDMLACVGETAACMQISKVANLQL